jgi:hypothetical protein
MKRQYLLAAGLLALTAPACHRDNCACPGTTNTTGATVTPAPAPAPPQLTSAELPSPPSTDATPGPVAGTTATATPRRAPRTATAPVDISGPTPAAPTTDGTTGTTDTTPEATEPPMPAGYANVTSTSTTTGAPLVSPGLDNTVSGGVANTGAPFNYSAASPSPWFGPAPMTTMSRPIGGPMRPGAASNPDTTSGAR